MIGTSVMKTRNTLVLFIDPLESEEKSFLKLTHLSADPERSWKGSADQKFILFFFTWSKLKNYFFLSFSRSPTARVDFWWNLEKKRERLRIFDFTLKSPEMFFRPKVSKRATIEIFFFIFFFSLGSWSPFQFSSLGRNIFKLNSEKNEVASNREN